MDVIGRRMICESYGFVSKWFGMEVEHYRIVDGIGICMGVWGLGRLVCVHCKLKFVEFLVVSCKWSWLKWDDAPCQSHS